MSKGRLRKRAVAVVTSGGKVLLVRDKGKKHYSLPGGGVKYGERSYQAAIRELYEETRLRVRKTTWLGSCEGTKDQHKAYLIEVRGDVHLNRRELDDYKWWDMKSPLPVFGHVKVLLSKLYVNKRVKRGR